jgi:hypothetical protein
MDNTTPTDEELGRIALAGATTQAEIAFRVAVMNKHGGGVYGRIRQALTLIAQADESKRPQYQAELTEHLERLFAQCHVDVAEGRLHL